jgi:hypothetical protein
MTMSLFDVHTRRLKTGAAGLGGAAVVAMGLIGVAAGSAPDARAGIVNPPSPMTAGQTTTETIAVTSPEMTVVPRAAPVLKAPRYGG